ncbi:MAG: oligosaccharide repeat unit polymerase [Acidobacteria bacterium]|nr:oligosaccharide repeat unit polymerase [Acidobacteriota bacterium]
MPDRSAPLLRYFRFSAVTTLVLLVTGFVVLVEWQNLHWETHVFSSLGNFLPFTLFAIAAAVLFSGCWQSEWDMFAPQRLFYTVWFGLLGLGSLHLTAIDSSFTLRFWVTVSAGLIAFRLGCWGAGQKPGARPWISLGRIPSHWKIEWSAKRALLGAWALCLVSLAAFLYAYHVAGTVPLLSDDPESARFEFGVNSVLSRFIVSFYIIFQLGYIGFAHLGKYRTLFAGLVIAAVIAITLLTMRFFLFVGIWTVVVFWQYGRRRLNPKGLFLVLVVAYPVAKLAIDVKRFHENPVFVRVLDKIDFPERWRAFAPDYLYFNLTTQTLDHLTFLIPNEIPYQQGWYTAYPIRVFWTQRQGQGFRGRLDDLLWERSTDWSPIASVTTTYMGVPYADFGIPGVFAFSLVFGWLATRTYLSLRQQPTFWRILLYSQLSFAIGLSFYANYLTLFEMYWNLAVMGAVHLFASHARIPHSDSLATPRSQLHLS